MTQGKRTAEQKILTALKLVETGSPVPEVCRRMGVAQATFYRWKKLYAGCDVAELNELKRLRAENTRMKNMIADLSLDKHILQEAWCVKTRPPHDNNSLISPLNATYE